MRPENKKELIKDGIILVLICISIFVSIKTGTITLSSKPEPPKFSIVDKYGKCDVVQYNHTGDSKFHYFLDCSK